MSGNKSGFKRFDFFEVDSAVISSSLSAAQHQVITFIVMLSTSYTLEITIILWFFFNKVEGYTLNCGAAESGTIALGDNSGKVIIADSRLFSGDNNGSSVQISVDRTYKVFRGEVIGIGIILDSNLKFSSTPRQYLLAVGEEIIPTSDSDKGSQLQYFIKVRHSTTHFD